MRISVYWCTVLRESSLLLAVRYGRRTRVNAVSIDEGRELYITVMDDWRGDTSYKLRPCITHLPGLPHALI
jgi:hypothetical protein